MAHIKTGLWSNIHNTTRIGVSVIKDIVNECIAAGITEIVLVTHSSKNAVENHFDKSF